MRLILLALLCFSIDSYKSYFGKVSMQPQDHQHSRGGQEKEWTLNDKDCGRCYIRKSNHPNELIGHNGLLIYKKPYINNYVVYDLRCPVCDKKKVSSTVYVNNTAIEAECDKCKTRYSLFAVGHSLNDPKAASEGLWLESYTFTILMAMCITAVKQ